MIPKKPIDAKWTDDQWLAIWEDNSNILVSAGAGSGKTAVLTERVIRKISCGVNVNELLVLTFTNEAAKEMKSRIRDAISKKGLKEQLDLLESSYITTFDSFALSLVKKYHYALGISKNITNIDASIINIKKRKLLDDILQKYYKDSSVFGDFVTIYGNKDDTKLKEAIIDIGNELDKKINKKSYLEEYINSFYLKNNIDNLINDFMNYVMETKREIITLYSDLLSYLEDKQASDLISSFEGLINANSYDSIKNNIPSMPKLKLEDDSKKIKDELKKKVELLKALVKYENTHKIRESFDLIKPYVDVIIKIILEIDENINAYKKKYNAYEFNDIAVMAIKLIENNQDIRDEIKYSFNEIMLDEYQDTSDIQETLITLISNNNVYAVGDQKQSIYRFRNANPFIFSNKYNEYSKGNGGLKIDLKDNFRLRKEIIESINKVFSSIMDDKYGNAKYEESHQMNFGNKSYEKEKPNQNYYLEVYNYEENKGFTNEEIEAFIIARDIEEKIKDNYLVLGNDGYRPLKYGDICIIVDRGTNFNLYKKILEYKGIPCTIKKEQTLTTGYDIMVLRNLLNIVIKVNENSYDEEFKYSYTSVARSFLFEESDTLIYNEIKSNKYNEKIIKKCKEININEEVPSTIIYKLLDVFDFYENIIKVGNIEETFIKIDSIISLAESLTEEDYTIKDFYNYLGEMIDGKDEIKYKIDGDSANNVKLMTIHSSKGLQFSLCYFLGYEKPFNIDDIKKTIYFDNKYGIIMPYYDEGLDTIITKELAKKNYIEDEISEKIRLLYVALTRAKEKMIIVSQIDDKEKYDTVPNSIKKNYRCFKDIISSTNSVVSDTKIASNYVDVDYIKRINKSFENIKCDKKMEFVDLKLSYNLCDEKHYSKVASKLFTQEEIKKMEYGTKVHEMFEFDDFDNPKNKRVKEFLKLIDKPLKVYKEYEFMSDNTVGVIDLLLEYSDYYMIVDYKLKNISDDEYKKQISGYKKYIEKVTGKDVYTYLYSIIDNKLLKID